MRHIRVNHSPVPHQVRVRGRLVALGRRAAARLEGVVRNKGIKPKRKEPRAPVL